MPSGTINDRIEYERRLSKVESRAQDTASDMSEMKDTVDSIFETLQEIDGKITTLKTTSARDRGFFAGMSFAYSSLGILLGAGIDYLLHK